MHIIPIKRFFPEGYPSQDELLRKLTEPVIKANYHSVITIFWGTSAKKLPGTFFSFYFLMFYSNTKLI